MFSGRTGWQLEESGWSRAASQARRAGILDLTESNPTRCGFSFYEPSLLEPFLDSSNILYEPDSLGLLSARSAIVRYYSEKNSSCAEERIILTAGTSEAYSALFKLLLNPGESIFVPEPGYPLLDHLAQLSDVHLIRYPLRYDDDLGWSINREVIFEKAPIGLRAMVVVNPNNPTGNRVSEDEQLWLEGWAAERGVALISDEVFIDFPFKPSQSALSFTRNKKALTFTLSGVSKILGLPQMKLSWIAVSGPDDLVCEAMNRLIVISDAFLSVAGPSQRALAGWLGRREKMIQEIQSRVCENREVLESSLSGTKFHLLKAWGGWNAVIRFDHGITDEQASLQLMKKGVLLQPGFLFDLPESHLVTSLLPKPALFLDGVRCLLNLV